MRAARPFEEKMSPGARSRSREKGMWQFTTATDRFFVLTKVGFVFFGVFP